jgi:APA family basic amino acid/polyamine antiporter
VPEFLCSDPFSHPGAWFNLPAFLIMAATTVVLVLGIRESAWTNTLLVLIKTGVVLFVIGVGWFYVDPGNWTSIPLSERIMPEQPEAKWGLLTLLGIDRWLLPLDEQVRCSFAPYGLSGIMLGAAIVFFAYIGFDSVSTHAEEARRPQRDVPIAVLASLIVCTLLYIGVAAVITGMERYPDVDPNAAIAAAFRRRAEATGNPLLQAAAGLIAVGALAGMTSVLLITFLSQARIFLAMARDRLLPPSIFAAVHPTFRTPHRSTILTGVIVSILAGVTPITMLEEMVNIGTLLAFAIVCGAVLILRIRRPEAQRPFRCPWIYLVAPCGILVNVVLMLFLPWGTWLRLIGWLAAGLVVYFSFGLWHSKLHRRESSPCS